MPVGEMIAIDSIPCPIQSRQKVIKLSECDKHTAHIGLPILLFIMPKPKAIRVGAQTALDRKRHFLPENTGMKN